MQKYGVHGQDLLLYVLADAGLVLFQHLRLKFPLPVPVNRYRYISKAGAQRFAAVAIAAVVCVLVLVVVFAVAQLVIQLRLQAILHELGNGLLEQILDVIHAADVCHLQQLTDLLSTGIFFRGAILSGHMVNLLCGASILHHTGGLHKTWDSLDVSSVFIRRDSFKYLFDNLLCLLKIAGVIVAAQKLPPLFNILFRSGDTDLHTTV